jgi:hypothetical protein
MIERQGRNYNFRFARRAPATLAGMLVGSFQALAASGALHFDGHTIAPSVKGLSRPGASAPLAKQSLKSPYPAGGFILNRRQGKLQSHAEGQKRHESDRKRPAKPRSL